jgi:hypothetical protein
MIGLQINRRPVRYAIDPVHGASLLTLPRAPSFLKLCVLLTWFNYIDSGLRNVALYSGLELGT